MAVYRFVLILGLMAVMPVQGLAAETELPIDFDIFSRQDSLVVWVNLAPMISSRRLEQMKQGVDIALEWNLSLLRPKRLWGAEDIAGVSGIKRIGYRIVTEDFFISSSPDDSLVEKSFLTLAQLHQFLSDSISLPLCGIGQLDHRKRYYIDLRLTCISLTSINLAPNDSEGADSPLRALFSAFLDLTDFGREEYGIKSRSFSLSEILPK